MSFGIGVKTGGSLNTGGLTSRPPSSSKAKKPVDKSRGFNVITTSRNEQGYKGAIPLKVSTQVNVYAAKRLQSGATKVVSAPAQEAVAYTKDEKGNFVPAGDAKKVWGNGTKSLPALLQTIPEKSNGVPEPTGGSQVIPDIPGMKDPLEPPLGPTEEEETEEKAPWAYTPYILGGVAVLGIGWWLLRKKK